MGQEILTLRKVTDEGNVYGFDRIVFLAFNFDGDGTALVLEDGELDTMHVADVIILLEDPLASGYTLEPAPVVRTVAEVRLAIDPPTC